MRVTGLGFGSVTARLSRVAAAWKACVIAAQEGAPCPPIPQQGEFTLMGNGALVMPFSGYINICHARIQPP